MIGVIIREQEKKMYKPLPFLLAQTRKGKYAIDFIFFFWKIRLFEMCFPLDVIQFRSVLIFFVAYRFVVVGVISIG